MIIKDLFFLPEVNDAIELMVQFDDRDPERRRKALHIWVDELKTLTPNPEEIENIALAYRDRDFGEYGVYVPIYIKKDLDAYKVISEVLDLDADTLPIEDLESYMELIRKSDFISPFGYEFSPWEDTLGVQVDETAFFKDNILADAIKDILWDMSFNGITRESQEERRKELEESLAESERIRSLPKEEQEQHYTPWSKVRKDLEEKLGLEDTRTPEEKEAERQQMLRDSLYSIINRERAILSYQKSRR